MKTCTSGLLQPYSALASPRKTLKVRWFGIIPTFRTDDAVCASSEHFFLHTLYTSSTLSFDSTLVFVLSFQFRSVYHASFFLVFGKQTYTSEAAAIVSKTFHSTMCTEGVCSHFRAVLALGITVLFCSFLFFFCSFLVCEVCVFNLMLI